MNKSHFDILKACDDANLFGQWFRDKATWAAWRVFLAALFALPMDDDQLAIYRKHTGRTAPPTGASTEAWLVVGRRGGKSFQMALIATYLATFRDYRPYLQQGERATVAVIAADRKQARVIMRYIRALLTQIPILKAMIQNERSESFDLSGRVTIEVTTASQRATRGYTYASVLCDEIAFWSTDEDSAEPDYAILDAIRPGMATIPGSMLLCASSPYARRGALWDAFRRYFGPNAADGAPLVWHATTREMNSTVPQRLIDEAMDRDPASASAEYLAQFRSDLEALLTREAVDACVSPGIRERAPVDSIAYYAFVDPSGGSSDSMTLAIAHREANGSVILDAVRERVPPFSPEKVVAEFAATIKSYRLRTVTGDRYAGEWPRERFKHYGISYEVAELTRSELYLDIVPAVNSGRVRLLDHPKLANQFVALERRTSRTGRDIVDHPINGHDDLSNAAAGALVAAIASTRQKSAVFGHNFVTGRVVFHGEPRPRIWGRRPGISAADGVQYPDWVAAHAAAGGGADEP